jgi:transketolase
MLEINSRSIRFLSMLGQRGTAGQTLTDLANNDPRILCMTADLCTTSGLDRFREKHPDRLINVGIAEQNMIGVAAGLAMTGYQVFTSTFATFASMRALEQMRSLLAYMELNVKVIGMAAGFSMGLFGNTHYSNEDIAIARANPNLYVYSPADALETAKLMYAVSMSDKPCYIRLTGTGNQPSVYREDYTLILGKAITLMNGCDVALIATGSMVYQALQTAKLLAEYGLSSSVVNFHTIKPLDTDKIDQLAANHKLLVTIEEHSIIGGLGGAVAEHIATNAIQTPLIICGVRDRFSHAGDYCYLLEQNGLTAKQIADLVQESLHC